MAVFADTSVPTRQVLGSGRVFEAITGRGLDDFEIELGFTQGARSGGFPVELLRKPGGHFALQLVPERDMPAFAATGDVTLTATVTLPGRPAKLVFINTGPGALALADDTVTIGGTTLAIRRIAGAPFDFSAQVQPRPVALKGTVIRAHDPADPIAGVSVAAPGTPAAVTDAAGSFTIAALPVAETVDLALTEGTSDTVVPFRPDYAQAVNTVTLSLP